MKKATIKKAKNAATMKAAAMMPRKTMTSHRGGTGGKNMNTKAVANATKEKAATMKAAATKPRKAMTSHHHRRGGGTGGTNLKTKAVANASAVTTKAIAVTRKAKAIKEIKDNTLNANAQFARSGILAARTRRTT